MSKPKQMGHVKAMTIKLKEPAFDIDNMAFNAIALFVGQNGSGKSLVLKFNWATAMIAHTVINARQMGVPIDVQGISQYIMDNTFQNQNFTGLIAAHYENGTIELELEEGKLKRAACDYDPWVESAMTPVFMSTDMRTFDQIKQYFKMEKLLGSKEKILEAYRLYDVTYVEMLKVKLSKGLKATDAFKRAVLGFDGMEKYKFEEFFLKDESIWYKDDEGKEREMTTLSKGEQSLVNMVLANTW